MTQSGTNSNQSDTKIADRGTKTKKSEQLSTRELSELMGVNRDTFKRVRGSVRRR